MKDPEEIKKTTILKQTSTATKKRKKKKKKKKNKKTLKKKKKKENILKENETLREKINELEKKEELWKTKCAELINEQENNKKQNKEMIQYGQEKLLKRFLFFLDNFQQAIEISQEKANKSPELAAFLKGFEMSVEEFNKILIDQGVKKMQTVTLKDKFDPEKHEVIKTKENKEFAEDTILKVMRDGYYLHQRVLRPAWVKVNVKNKKLMKSKK